MKTTALFSAAIIMLAGAITSCSSGEKSKTKTITNADGEEIEVTVGASNIRCYNLDSVSANYKLVERLNAEVETAMTNYQNQERQKTNELQRMAQNIEDKMRNNLYLTEQSYNSDVQAFQNRQNQVQQQLAVLQQQLAQLTAMQQQQLVDSLASFLKDYNSIHGYDAILVMQPGTYFAPELDITDEVIEGLNARYVEVETPAADKK